MIVLNRGLTSKECLITRGYRDIYIYIDEENNEEVDGQVESKVHETYNSGIHKNNDASFCAHRTQKKNLGPSNFESILKSLTLHILNGNDIS